VHLAFRQLIDALHRKAQQQGAASCPGQSIPAARIEGAILAGLGELAEAGARQPLREALQGWS
jgi:hypothetical protein